MVTIENTQALIPILSKQNLIKVNDFIHSLLMLDYPTESISEEEMRELDNISKEMDAGIKYSIEDILAT